MTQAVISLDEGLEIARDVLGKIRGVNRNAVLCGGFPRDVQLGVAPKDIDVFITTNNGSLAEASGMLVALGYSSMRKLGADDDTYEEGLTVFELTKPGSYPIQLIFSPAQSPHPLKFDFGLCEIFLWAADEAFDSSRAYKSDVANKTLTIKRGRDSYAEQKFINPGSQLLSAKDLEKFLDHMHRLMAKYPEHRVIMCAEYLKQEQGRQLYNYLVQEGYFEDPRALFPTQRRDIEGDEVRLQDGGEGGAEVGGLQPAAVGAEAIPGGVPDQPQVQPGLARAAERIELLTQFLADRERVARRIFANLDQGFVANLQDEPFN